MSCDICHGHPNCPCCSDSDDFETCETCCGDGFVWVNINGELWDGKGNTFDCTKATCPDCGGDGIVYI